MHSSLAKLKMFQTFTFVVVTIFFPPLPIFLRLPLPSLFGQPLSHCTVNLILGFICFQFECLKKTSPVWKTVSFWSVHPGSDWSSLGQISMLKEWINNDSGSSTLLALFQGRRVLENPRRPLTDVPREPSIAKWGVGMGEHWQLDLVPSPRLRWPFENRCKRNWQLQKALAVYVIMERIRRKVLGDRRDQ